jgi:hypothetical protein
VNTRIDPHTARITGLLYLAMAVVAVPGFLIIRPLLFDPDSPTTTAANLVTDESLARVGIGLEFTLVIVQTLTALWFYRLFRPVNAFAAGAVVLFGTLNAVAIMASSAALAAGLDAALAADAAGAQLMYLLAEGAWGVGAVFFGLWLVPMGVLALQTSMPRALGWVLVAGGIAYVVSAYVAYLAPGAGPVADILAYGATVGEVWMIWYLVWAPRRSDRGALEARP